MVRVEVKNFQSIADEAVEIDGFAVVVGRSNIGKSALVRAVKAALTGAPVDSYVRHGQSCLRLTKGSKSCKCFCSVRILGPDLDLLWEKGDSVNRYVHNGTEHTVVGKGTPEFLGSRFEPIYIGGDTTPTVLQVTDQFNPLFILNRSGSAVADVLSDVAKLDQINVASRAAERDRKECQATRKVRERDLNELDQTLALYEGLGATLERVASLESVGEALAADELRLDTLERLSLELDAARRSVATLEPIAALSVAPPDAISVRATKLISLVRWEDQIRSRVSAMAALRPVATFEVPDLAEMLASSVRYQRLVRWADQLESVKAGFAKFRVAESVTVPLLPDLGTSHMRYRSALGWSERLAVLEKSLRGLTQDSSRLEAEEQAVLAEFKALEVCPTCNQPIQLPSP